MSGAHELRVIASLSLVIPYAVPLLLLFLKQQRQLFPLPYVPVPYRHGIEGRWYSSTSSRGFVGLLVCWWLGCFGVSVHSGPQHVPQQLFGWELQSPQLEHCRPMTAGVSVRCTNEVLQAKPFPAATGQCAVEPPWTHNQQPGAVDARSMFPNTKNTKNTGYRESNSDYGNQKPM